MFAELDRRLQYGPGMRAQRVVEASFLIAAFFADDVRLAYVTFASSVLQAISPRLVPVAIGVAAFVPAPKEHRLGDLYFDLAGARGACAISLLVQAPGIWLVSHGHAAWGWLLLALPAASCLLAPTTGFCCGCAFYVASRELLARLGLAKRYANGACDISVDPATAARGRQ